jgi:hypothetical protein
LTEAPLAITYKQQLVADDAQREFDFIPNCTSDETDHLSRAGLSCHSVWPVATDLLISLILVSRNIQREEDVVETENNH